MPGQRPDVYYALREYAEYIVSSIRAINAAERGRPNLEGYSMEQIENAVLRSWKAGLIDAPSMKPELHA